MGCLKIGYFQFQRIVIPFSTKIAINRGYPTTIISSWLIGYLIVNPVYPIIIYNYMYPIYSHIMISISHYKPVIVILWLHHGYYCQIINFSLRFVFPHQNPYFGSRTRLKSMKLSFSQSFSIFFHHFFDIFPSFHHIFSYVSSLS